MPWSFDVCFLPLKTLEMLEFPVIRLPAAQLFTFGQFRLLWRSVTAETEYVIMYQCFVTVTETEPRCMFGQFRHWNQVALYIRYLETHDEVQRNVISPDKIKSVFSHISSTQHCQQNIACQSPTYHTHTIQWCMQGLKAQGQGQEQKLLDFQGQGHEEGLQFCP